jgi:1,3-beta-glucan synthase
MAHPQQGGGHYADDGYGHGNDGYYQDDQNQAYYDHNQQQAYGNGQDSYYDEGTGQYAQGEHAPPAQQGQEGYYDAGHNGYQDEYYNDQYYDQGHAAGQQGARQPRGHSEEDSETFSDFTMRSDMARAAEMDYYGRGDERYNSYNGEQGARGAFRPPSSQVSYGGNRSSGASTPVYGMDYTNALPAGQRSREPYPAWTSDAQIPLSKEEIEDIFLDLTAKFGFQRDSMRNMFDHFMTLLDDYIGGDNANYRRWYFAAHLDLDDAVGFANMNLGKANRRTRKARKAAKKKAQDTENEEATLSSLEGDNSLEAAEYRWKSRMNKMSQHDRVRQIALYLLCWGEANQVRFMPELSLSRNSPTSTT